MLYRLANKLVCISNPNNSGSDNKVNCVCLSNEMLYLFTSQELVFYVSMGEMLYLSVVSSYDQ